MEKVKQNYQMLISGKKQYIDMAFRFYPAEKNSDSLEMKWFHCTASMIYYHGEKATLFNLMDVTITKELDNILRVQDKMVSLGRVAAGIAHEIRNPLSGINIYLNTLKKITGQYDNSEKTAKILSQLQSASNKIESVIKRVMDFSRPTETKFSLTDINDSIMEAVNLTSVTLRKSGIQFSTALSDNLPKCMADSHMIEQVILNLIANASEAMQNMDKDKRINISSFLENNNIYIKVKDSGHGIPQDIRNDIFEPFYTTKNSGSGIGLNICHRIITDHGGTLELSSAEQKGAEFIIKIPINGQNR
ncbi:MAG TPA: GHKL domain-containing protein [Desulfobacterales bacterium]|nr:GHKL domain-containing protein [Desulfobacterales bacterium]